MSYSKIILFGTIVFLKSSIAAPLSPAATEFESLLIAADCASVHANKAFDLRVFGRSFPVAKGFDFFGDDYRRVIFRDMPEAIPVIAKTDHPNDKNAVDEYLSRGSIFYGAKEEDDQTINDREQFYESLQWNGIRLLFRLDVGGQIVRTTTYQLIAYSSDSDFELTITVIDPRIAADSIACAVSTVR